MMPMTFLSSSQMGATMGAMFLPNRSRSVAKAALKSEFSSSVLEM